jgi:hypothetical protein
MKASWAIAALAVAAGAWLRWYQLDIQLLLDDEWHAVHQILHSDAHQIATHFGFADYSIPLTLYYRFLAAHGGLSEWQMHLPVLIAGIGFLVIAPWLLGRDARFEVKCAWVGLLALSPLLVYHARVARPYAIACLLVFAAIALFRRWWLRSGRPRIDVAAYVLCTFTAGYLHPLTLVFSCGPFLYYGIASLARLRSPHTRAEAIHGLTRLAILGVVTLGALAIVLAPPLMNDWQTVRGKAGQDSLTFESAYRTALLVFGTANPFVCAALLLLALSGIRRTWQRDRDLALYWKIIAVAGTTAIIFERPINLDHPLVLARYALPMVPWLLWMVAEGACALFDKAPVVARPALVVIGWAAYFWVGPIPEYLYYPNQFMGHARFQYDYDSAHNPFVTRAPKRPIPEFYRQLSSLPPGSVTLVEAPFRFESYGNPHPWYQEVHRQRVKAGLMEGACPDRSFGEYPEERSDLRFGEHAHLTAILAGRDKSADYLVMHLEGWVCDGAPSVEWPDLGSCVQRIKERLGAPAYEDSQIVVFRLNRK